MSIIALASIPENVQNYEYLTLKLVLINEGESTESCEKCLLLKTYEWHKRASCTDLIKKGLTQCVKNRCICGH